MNKRGLLIILSGPSGSGKSTLIKSIRKAEPDLVVSVSATTRPPRQGEVDGESYYFISKQQFEELIKNDEMLEYAEYVGNYYGTPKKPVEHWLSSGKDVLLEIEVQGALKVKDKCPEAVSVFVMPSSMEVLKERLMGRGTEDEKLVRQRLNQAMREIEYMDSYDYCIRHDSLSDVVNAFKSILKIERDKKRGVKKC